MQNTLQDIVDKFKNLSEATVVVSNTALLKVLERDPDEAWVDVLHHDGQTSRLAASAVAQTHFEIDDGGYLKPRYRPLRALVLSKAVVVADGGAMHSLASGDAILIDGTRAVLAVSRHDYLRDYEALRPGHLAEFLMGSARSADTAAHQDPKGQDTSATQPTAGCVPAR
jgi:hypothetical protein